MKFLKLSNANKKMKISRPLKIKSFILDHNIIDKETTTLFIFRNGLKLPLFSLVPGKVEMINVDLIFQSDFCFEVSNRNIVNVVCTVHEILADGNKNRDILCKDTNNAIRSDENKNIGVVGNGYNKNESTEKYDKLCSSVANIRNQEDAIFDLISIIIDSEVCFKESFDIVFTLATTDSNERVSLIVDVDNVDHTVCNLFPGAPNFRFNFLYDSSDVLKLKIIGKGRIIVWGYRV